MRGAPGYSCFQSAGELPDPSSACLQSLKVLDLTDNSMGGQLPMWLMRKDSPIELLKLEQSTGLAFHYDSDSDRVDSIVHLCLSAETICFGIPPTSCKAFGTDFYVCDDCRMA